MRTENEFLDAARQTLSEHKFDEIAGELWLRWPHVKARLAAGAEPATVVAAEVRRARALLVNPAGKSRNRPHHRVRTQDFTEFDDKKVRQRW